MHALTDLPAGFRALLDCVRGAPAEELAASLARAEDAGEDVCALAATHGLRSLLYLRVQATGVGLPVSREVWERLRAEHYGQAARQARSYDVACETAEAFRAAGLQTVLPIKGLALAALSWPEYRPRDMFDLDFLAAAGEVPAAEETLGSLGFSLAPLHSGAWPMHQHRPTLMREGVAVELHTMLWPPGSLPFSAPEPTALAARAIEASLADRPFRAPGAEDCLLICAAILARDGFDAPLDRWADLHWLLTGPGLRPHLATLRELARGLRMEGLLSLVLTLAGELFGAEYGWAPPSSPEWSATYDRLCPILLIRLLSPMTGARHRHQLAVEVLHRGEGQSRPDARASVVSPLGGPVRAACRALAYLANLALSSRQRAELRDEMTLRRALDDLAATQEG
jgi:hypothetical protein